MKHKAVRVSYPFEVAIRSVKAGTMHPGRWALCRVIVKAIQNDSVILDGPGFRFELFVWLVDRKSGSDFYIIRHLESNEVWSSRREAITRGSHYGINAYRDLTNNGLPHYAALKVQKRMEI